MRSWYELSPKERDELVATDVMGWTKQKGAWCPPPSIGQMSPVATVPDYSSDLIHAWAVLELFAVFRLTKVQQRHFHVYIDSPQYSAIGTSPMEAICKAALRRKNVAIT